MLKKLFFFTSLIVSTILFVNSSNNNTDTHDKKNTPVKYNIVSHDGEIVGLEPAPPNPLPLAKWDNPAKTIFTYDSPENIIITTQEVSIDARTTYDYQSNGAIRYIVQNPLNPQNLFSVFMVDPIGASDFPDRKTICFSSTNMGASWTSIGNITNVKSGFPSIDVLSDGQEIIALHTTDGGYASIISQAYVDAAPGIGAFIRLGPSSLNLSSEPEWPMISATLNISHNNKFIFIASENIGPAYFNIGTSLTSSNYLGWQPWPDTGGAQNYTIARGADGRIGIIYTNEGYNNPILAGYVFLKQTTDDGITFSSPTTIWQTNFFTDSLGCVRSLDLCYTNNTPNAVFAVCKTDASGGYFPESLSKILFWSPGINGGNPVTIDTCSMMRGSNPQADGFFSDCRPVIGRSSDNAVLYAAWCRSRPEFDVNNNNFFDIYFSYSTNGGLSWYPKVKITNTSGPLRDNRYVSMSQSNSIISSVDYVHLIYQMDSIPGSYVTGAQMSFARMMYAKISIDTLVGIKNQGTEISDKFNLEQNFPNPFNPSTKIRFEQPKNEFVTLKLYNANGQLITVLINEYQDKGYKEIEWNAIDMPSGIYFYTLEAGTFKQSRKMILLK